MLEIRPLGGDDNRWKARTLVDTWGDTSVARLGQLIDVMPLDGLVAYLDGERRGLLTFDVAQRELEVVTLHAETTGRGIGRALMDAARQLTVDRAARRMWLTTTNDNIPAISFYQQWGMDLVRLHYDGAGASRAVKQSIPMTGFNGIPIRHELEFELVPTTGE